MLLPAPSNLIWDQCVVRIRDRGGAVLAEPMDDMDPADKMSTVALDPDLQARLSTQALARSRDFDWKRSAALILEALRRVAKQSKTPVASTTSIAST